MQPFFGLFNLGGGEIVLILTFIPILIGAKKLPDFRNLLKGMLRSTDDEATEAGRSLGGIYGKPAAEALTADNQVAELYNPTVLQNDSAPHNRTNIVLRLFARLLAPLHRLFRRIHRTS